MESSLKFLNKSLNGYCAFIDEKYRLLVICASKVRLNLNPQDPL